MAAATRTVPAAVAPRGAAPADRRAETEPAKLLEQLAPLLGQLAARYPEVPAETIRHQTFDVLRMVTDTVHRISAVTVARLVEARVLALL